MAGASLIWTAIGIVFWILVGALIAVVCIEIRGRMLWKKHVEDGGTEFGLWLEKECEARFSGKWRKCRIVAVSHKGAVAVRSIDDESGHNAKWIPKEQVPERVRWIEEDEL